MATGACGINCDVCLLKRLGTCSSCGPGKGVDARKKIQAQIGILGGPCRVLQCASLRGIDHCPGDCLEFPCELYHQAEYPYAPSFLQMQQRRRTGHLFIIGPNGEMINEPKELWDQLSLLSSKDIAERGDLEIRKDQRLLLRSLGRELIVDLKERALLTTDGRPLSPLWKVITLNYLLNAQKQALSGRLMGISDLRSPRYFEGAHKINVGPLLNFLDRGAIDIRMLLSDLDAKLIPMGDLALRFPLFPRVPVWMVYWRGDEEFGSELKFLFDSTIDEHLPVAAIWGGLYVIMEAVIKSQIHRRHRDH